MSRRCSKEVRPTGCNHCKNLGESRNIYENHNTIDAKGRVVCPKILTNCCFKCNHVGHLPSRCIVVKNVQSGNLLASVSRLVAKLEPKVELKSRVAVAAPKSENLFACLHDSDSEDVSPRTPTKKPVASTPRAPVKSAKVKDWADYDSDDDW